VRAAPPGSAFVILTHDHALDFLLSAEALGRGDAAYVGMIGSATKRAAFRAWCRRQGGPRPATDLPDRRGRQRRQAPGSDRRLRGGRGDRRADPHAGRRQEVRATRG
jgi:hypothetical protein